VSMTPLVQFEFGLIFIGQTPQGGKRHNTTSVELPPPSTNRSF
jgi:hypothetical protein